MRRLSLLSLPGTYAICRLAADAAVPGWAVLGPVWSALRTPEELSILCELAAVPSEVQHEPGWRGLRVAGALAPDEVGVLAALTAPLAAAGVSLFALSSFDTDYLFVRGADWAAATEALRAAGHEVPP